MRVFVDGPTYSGFVSASKVKAVSTKMNDPDNLAFAMSLGSEF
jgi:hypothetical protein